MEQNTQRFVNWKPIKTVKENYNAFQDDDGCPDNSPESGEGIPTDSDGDGFIDNLDDLSSLKTTKNNFDQIIALKKIWVPAVLIIIIFLISLIVIL